MTYFKYIFVCTIVFSVIVCSCRGNDKALVQPLNDAQLETVLCDVHIVEAALQTLNFRQKDSLAPIYYKQLLERNKISKQQLDDSFRYLTAHPDEMDLHYEKVIKRLQNRNNVQ